MEFTEKEQAILRIVQKNLPDTLTPYADIAAAVGATEEEVLETGVKVRAQFKDLVGMVIENI